MPDPTQETPQGHEIPVPLRDDVFADLRKVAKPIRPDQEESGEGTSGAPDQQ